MRVFHIPLTAGGKAGRNVKREESPMYKDVRNYGWIAGDECADFCRTVYSRPQQNLSGYPLGIITPPTWFPQMPGNVGNPWTYDFPVRYLRSEVEIQQLFDNDPGAVHALLEEARELEREGCRAITGNCGYYAHFQRELAEAVDVPVAMSSLLQVNWIRPTLKEGEKIGVICAAASSFTPELLLHTGVEDPEIVVVAGLEDTEQFGPLARQQMDVNYYNPRKLGEEIAAIACGMMEENDLGAILLECSDLPPFAHMVQAATNLPVFDFTTLHNWLYNAVCRRPFTGFL